MDGFTPYADEVESWIALYMLIVARLSFVVFFLPGIGEQVVPVRIRLLVLLTLSALISMADIVVSPPVLRVSSYSSLLLGEIGLGLFLGVTLRFSIWMLSIAGSVIAQSIGLSQLLGIAVENEAQTITANILAMAGVAILLTADFHINVFAALIGMYADLPVGSLSWIDAASLADRSFAAFGFAILLVWPFLVLNLLYNICLGFINKALPQLMVAFVGAPFMVGGGTMILALSMTGLLIMWKDRALQIIGWL